MLQWKRANELSKDLSIVNIQAFRKETYRRLSDNFFSDAVNINRHLCQVLQSLPETGSFPSGQKRNSQSIFNRNGYMNLYRWCVTDNPRFAGANGAATALWEFLFGDLPRQLAEAGGNDGNDIITEEKVWNDWYAGIS
ncbi:hypothetical protein [Desulfonema magnum]|uniref:Uncharacterized protein n=1 Tax=Desulfonema magnum TaxID=45655 RepID=A0A975BI04_9BACT|nr:hypothetical protein [Desulfonema magnum]QTA85716.1 Uncharacterized protein dnm_017300 [Desulfonema magnum]